MILPVSRISTFIVLLIAIVFTSCEKYLEEKSNQKLVVPTTLADLQSLLDNYMRVNQADPSAGERSADNYYLTYNDWSGITETERRVYTWEKDYLFNRGNSNDWGASYDNVYRANTVLDHLDKITRAGNDQNDWNNVKGQALFLRAKSFLQVAHIWALQYDPNTASTTLGIPLRLGTDINEVSTRATLQETYDRIIQDLMAAIGLLPNTALHKLRPARPAALSLLARCYLSMRNYDSCWKYSDQSLRLDNSLLTYNNITVLSNTSTTASSFERFNPEVLYDSYMATSSSLANSRAKIDSTLYLSYALSDRRRGLFFRPNPAPNSATYRFRGSYAGPGGGLFSGIANDEVYLMRAECYARAGKTAEAMADLNALLSKRWTGTYTALQATDATDALNKILVERRKELLMRGLRWMDIKRLNAEGANITLRRILNTQTYTLPPNDLRFALAIPEDVIELSGMQQNPR